MKRCVFINLAAAADRRRTLEASFAAANPTGWSLERFEALGPADVASVPGRITPSEKACFASHRAAIARHLDDEDDLFVVEDDAVFSPQAFGVINAVLNHDKSWDVLFTDTVTSDLVLMVRLAKLRDGMVATGQYDVLNLARRMFFSATAYVVRGSAKRAVHDLLAAAVELDEPYDLFLRSLAHGDKLKMGACFPYVTSVAAHAETSQIQPSTGVIDRSLNAYRRLMYVARDLEDCRRETDKLRDDYADDASRIMGSIFAAIVSPAFPSDN